MAVTDANFKLFKSTGWNTGSAATNGGTISATEVSSTADQAIFDDVTNDERVAGLTDYRKVFFKNVSPNDTVSIKCFISDPGTNQTISIAVEASGGDFESGLGGYTWSTASTLGTGIDLGELVADASKGVWVKRVVTAGANGITGDAFALTFGMY